MSSITSSTEKSVKKEIVYVYTWIIEDFECSKVDLLSVNNLPAVKLEFDLGANMHFIGYLSLQGETCYARIMSLTLRCTNQDKWKVNCNIVLNRNSYLQCLLSYNKPYGDWLLYESFSCSCLLGRSPVTLLLKISHVSYEPTSKAKFPIKKSQFTEEFYQLFETKKFSDVLFNVAGTEIRAHKNILACRSPVFEAMFEHQMTESLSNKVEIEDMEPAVFEDMLRFIYTDEVKNLKTMADKLLPASDKYNLPRLMSMCAVELADCIEIENAAETYILADLHGANDLKKWSLLFMKNNKKSVALTLGWKQILKHHTHLLDELLLELLE